MMRPRVYVKKCPACAKHILHVERSGSSFHSVLWSDGQITGPMTPRLYGLVMCPYCRTGIWANDLSVIEDITRYLNAKSAHSHAMQKLDDSNIVYAQYDDTQYTQSMSFPDYMTYLETARIDVSTQIYVREIAWWVANDARRIDPSVPLTPPEIANMRALLLLIDAVNVNDWLITKAEILRELADFAAARRCLELATNAQNQKVVTFLLQRIDARDATLQLIT